MESGGEVSEEMLAQLEDSGLSEEMLAQLQRSGGALSDVLGQLEESGLSAGLGGHGTLDFVPPPPPAFVNSLLGMLTRSDAADRADFVDTDLFDRDESVLASLCSGHTTQDACVGAAANAATAFTRSVSDQVGETTNHGHQRITDSNSAVEGLVGRLSEGGAPEGLSDVLGQLEESGLSEEMMARLQRTMESG
eukprot:SAG31_NODE_20316_length_577_cov_21.205021_1_plen_192_part_11